LLALADEVKDFFAKHEVSPIDPHIRFLACSELAHCTFIVELCEMEGELRADCHKASDLATSLQAFYDLREWGVGQSVSIVGKKEFFILKQMFDGHKPFANVAPDPRIDERNTPIRRIRAKHFHLLAEIGDDKIPLG